MRRRWLLVPLGIVVSVVAIVAGAVNAAADIRVARGDNLATKFAEARSGDRVLIAEGEYGHVHTTLAFRSDVIVMPETRAAVGSVTTQGWRFDSGAAHVVLRGLRVREPEFNDAEEGSAVTVDEGASDIAIEDCKLTEGRHGLRIVSNDNSTPANVTLRDSEVTGSEVGGGIQIDAVNIGGGSNITIDHNRMHDIHIGLENGEGEPQHDDGVQAFRGNGIAITRNTIYQTTPGPAGPNQGIIVGRSRDTTGVESKDVENVTIYDNLIYQWPGSGITISGATTVTVVHNTSYDIGEGSDNALSISEPLETNRTPRLNSGLTIANDILEKFAIVSEARSPATCTTNLIQTFSPRAASSACTSTDTSEPAFEGRSSPYYLQSRSTAIDAANATYALPAGLGDVDETTRVGTADIGAREWHPLTDTLTGEREVLSRHSGEGGVSWTLDTADPGTASLVADTLQSDAENTIYSYTAGWTPSDNTYAAETTIVYREPGAGQFSGPVCRWSPSGSKNGYMARIKDGELELVQFVRGTGTVLRNAAISPAYYAGQPLKIGMYCGRTKEVYLDGTSVLSSSDDTVTQIGTAGVRGNAKTLPVDAVDAFDVS